MYRYDGDSMKKKAFIALVCLCLLGCSNKSKETQYKYFFLFATPLKNHVVWKKAEKGFLDACKNYQIDCECIGPNNIDTDRMNEVVETGILMKVDGIITQGVIDSKLIDVANEKEIPLVLVDSDQPKSKRFAYMGKDFKEQATLLLEDIESKYGKNQKLKVAIQVAELKFKIAQKQIEDIKKVFSTHKGGVEIISVTESKSDILRAKREWERVFGEHKDINIAINFAGESAVPCAETAIQKQIRDHMLIYGVDEVEETMNMIKNHKIDGTIVTSFYDYGYKSVETIYKYLKYKKKPANQVLRPKLILVNRDNIQDYDEKVK